MVIKYVFGSLRTVFLQLVRFLCALFLGLFVFNLSSLYTGIWSEEEVPQGSPVKMLDRKRVAVSVKEVGRA